MGIHRVCHVHFACALRGSVSVHVVVFVKVVESGMYVCTGQSDLVTSVHAWLAVKRMLACPSIHATQTCCESGVKCTNVE